MKTSEALTGLHTYMYGPVDQKALQKLAQSNFLMLAQAPPTASRTLSTLPFEAPAAVYALHRESPEKAQQHLLTSIAAAIAAESVTALAQTEPSEQDWERFLQESGWLETLHKLLKK